MQSEPFARPKQDRRELSRSTAGVGRTQICQRCHSGAHLSCVQMPEFRDVRYYRCENCGSTWATDLKGAPTLMGRETSDAVSVG